MRRRIGRSRTPRRGLVRKDRVSKSAGYALNPNARCNPAGSCFFLLMETQIASPAKFSVFAIIAIVAAILSFVTGPLLGLVFAAVAILFGGIGMVSAMRASVRGGFVGMLSIVAGIVGIVAA